MDSELAQTKKGNITMKTEMAVMRPQTKECWWPGEAGKENKFSSGAFRGNTLPTP